MVQRQQQIAQAAKERPSPVHTGLPCHGLSPITAPRPPNPITPNLEEQNHLIQRVLDRDNMFKALERVEKNKGAPGVDGIPVTELREFLKSHWKDIKASLLNGTYQPAPTKRVTIPKPGGGRRQLGIPTVLDRLIQQAIAQILTPIFDPRFSDQSYGFRPGRNAHMAVRKALEYQKLGYTYVVDMDLEKFFDRVNHDILMGLVAKVVKDKILLKLIRSYLTAGLLEGGLTSGSREGTPQGSPLSPLLSNIMLDIWDKELEKRGHKFCRYVDDQNIYVKSKRAGERVFSSVKAFLMKRLKLGVNEAKSAVDFAWKRKFLGYTFLGIKTPKIRVAKESLKRLKTRIKEVTRGHRSQPIESRIESLNIYLRGWMGYFQLTETPGTLKGLDSWIRHRLRMCMMKQWRKPKTRVRNLLFLGLPEEQTRLYATGKRYWYLSNTKWMNMTLNRDYWERKGFKSLEKLHQDLKGGFTNRRIPNGTYGGVRGRGS